MYAMLSLQNFIFKNKCSVLEEPVVLRQLDFKSILILNQLPLCNKNLDAISLQFLWLLIFK